MKQNIINDILMNIYTERKEYKKQIVWNQEKMERKRKQIDRKNKLEQLNGKN